VRIFSVGRGLAILAALISSGALVSSYPAAPAWGSPLVGNLAGNHSFESPSICPAGSEAIPAGSSLLGAWTVTGNATDAVELICSDWTAENGQQSLDLNGSQPGSISQTITDTPGTRYFISFWLGGDVDGGPASKSIQMSWDGQTVNYHFNITGKTATDMQWHRYSELFPGTGSDVLTFTGTSPGAFGAVIDNVKVKVWAHQ
jgi:choice-of-anchor C domain-containing protein